MDNTKDYSLSELRPMLIDARKRIGEMVKVMNDYIANHANAKTAYEREFARATVREYCLAKTAADKTPTIIKALATIDANVIVAKDLFDLASAKLDAFQVEFKAIEEDCLSIKKCMGTVQSEMQTFGN